MTTRLSLSRLECFVAVAEELSFTRASERLQFAQPWVSSQVRKLEQDLNLVLFHRSTRHVEPTAAAYELLPEARRLLAAAERTAAAIGSIGRSERGELRVGSPPQLALTLRYPAVAEYVQRSASAVHIHNAPSVDLLPALRRGDLDVAFLAAPLPVDDLHTRTVEDGYYVLQVPKGHHLEQHEVVPLRALRGERILTFGRHHNSELWDAQVGTLATAGVEFVEAAEPSASIMFRAAPASGLPVLAYPWTAEWMGESMGMVVRRIEGDPCRYSILLARRDSMPAPRLAEFWEVAVTASPVAAQGGPLS